MEDELCESCGENPGQLNSNYWKEESESEGYWVCQECEDKLQQGHEAWMLEMASVYGGPRRATSELYSYPVSEGDDVIRCPRCNDSDMFPGDRVCVSCLAEINADDYS